MVRSRDGEWWTRLTADIPMDTDKQDFTKSSRDRAKELIRAGKAEEAIEEVDRIWEEGRPIHDLYGDMTAVLLDYVKDKLGEPAVEEAWRSG